MKKLYSYIEECSVVAPKRIMIVTARDSLKKEIEHLRNVGIQVSSKNRGNLVLADIQFRDSRQIFRFATRLKVSKLWKGSTWSFSEEVKMRNFVDGRREAIVA